MKVKQLTFDHLFIFCTLLERIGVEDLLQSFSSLSGSEQENGQAAIKMMTGLLMRNLPRVKKDVYAFLAEVTVLEDGTDAKPEDIMALPVGSVIPYLKQIMESQDVKDFFAQAASLLGMGSTGHSTPLQGDTAADQKAQ